ncbi:MAG: hydantoinase/oxoprolinase family protein, partial [Pseudomonadota bacterium]
DMPDGPLTADNISQVVDSFFDVHKAAYGHAFRDQKTEGVTLRVVATADVEPLRLPDLAPGNRTDPDEARLETRPTTFDQAGTVATPRFDRTKLLAGDRLTGPALIIQHNSTTLLPPGYGATVLGHGDIRIARV